MTTQRWAAVALWLVLSAPALGSGTPETFAPDPRTLALSHADAADDGGAALAHTNAAAMARATGARFFAATSLSLPQLWVDLAQPPDDPALSPAAPAPVAGMAFGTVLPLSIGVPDRLSFGFSAYFPTLVLIRARTHDPARPFFYLYDSQTEHYDISASLALRVVDWFSLGAGARLTAGQGGTIDLAVDVVRGRLDHQSFDTYQYAVFAPTFGALLGPFGIPGAATGSVGFVWREPSEFDVALPASLAVGGADVNALLDVLIQSNYEPRNATLGVSVDVVDHVRVNVDAAWLFWSLAPPPYTRARVDLSGRTLEDAGLDDTLDAPAAGEERVRSPGFQDTLVLKAGVEGRLLRDVLALRAGYQLRPTPVPDQTSGTNVIDARAHVLGVGVGVQGRLPALVDNPVQFDLGYQVHVLEPRATQKENGNDVIGDWRAGGMVHALSCGLTYRW